MNTTTPNLHNKKVITDTFPDFWEKEVIYFANLLSLFFGNKQETKILEQQVQGIHTYGGRLISILNLMFKKGKNVILLENHPDEFLISYFKEVLGLTIPEIRIFTHKDYTLLNLYIKNKNSSPPAPPHFTYLKEHKSKCLDGFVTDETLILAAKSFNKSTIATVKGSKNGNNKYLLHTYLEKIGLPVFDTHLASNTKEVNHATSQLKKQGYKKFVLKSQIGASGCGLIIGEISRPPKKNYPDYLFFEGPSLIQGWIDEGIAHIKRIGSPSVQMFLTEKAVYLFDITEQLLGTNSVHEGNYAPPIYFTRYKNIREELLKQAEEAGAWLIAQRFRGAASCYFLIILHHNKMRKYTCVK